MFPKGTDSTLAVNGTNFKVDQTGKVTFISGQTFPGTGTVTSVGLSAPSSDFTVSGSPVTKSGTLNLNWSTAPTNLNTANAIVNQAAGGIGVLGIASNGITFLADGNVQQARTGGGWVKAMVYVNASAPPYSILRCFNCTLAGSAATTPPCGINFTEQQLGVWYLDFGFEVDDRFLSATVDVGNLGIPNNAHCVTAGVVSAPTTVVDVQTYDCGTTLQPGYFNLIVF